MHGSFLGPTRVFIPNLDRFSHFRRAHERDQKTQAEHTTPCVLCGNIRPLTLAAAAMRPKLALMKFSISSTELAPLCFVTSQ